MVSNYITVVYKFFLWAHRKQFLNVNSSKNKQPLAFKHRHAAAFSLYLLQSGYWWGGERKPKIPAKAGRAQRESCPVYISPGPGVALGTGARRVPPLGRDRRWSSQPRGWKKLRAWHRVPSAHCFCGFEIRTQPPPDKKERHFPNTAPSPGVGLGLGAGAKGPTSPPPHPTPPPPL